MSEIIALRSKAVLSTVLGISVILTIGFWSKLLPKDIIQLAHIPGIGILTVGMLLVSLGTTIDFAELRRQWQVAAVSVISVTMAVIFIIFLGPFFMNGTLAIAGSPIFAGGNAAMLIILDAVQEKGIETVGTFCIVLLVSQKFFGIPIASLMLRHLAKNLRDDRNFVKRYASEGKAEKANKPLRLPSLLDRPSVHLAKLSFVASLAYYASKLTGGAVHYLVMCLLFGTLFYALGFLEKGILQKTQSSGLILFFVTLVIFSSFSRTTPQDVLSVLPPLAATALLGVLGLFTAGLLTNRLFSLPFSLCVSLGVTCTFGFPTTMLVSQEVSTAMGRNEEERAALLHYLLPKMLVAGFVTVTITSVLLAGVVVTLL
nr:hypothetical protein [uncultured Acidaminococcus sp.]